MDLLSKRYASPFSLLNNLIWTEQFNEWVEYFLNKQTKEDDDKKMWDFFLHKVFDNKSFEEWKESATNNSSGANGVMDEAKKEEIIKDSEGILDGFKPSTVVKEGE